MVSEQSDFLDMESCGGRTGDEVTDLSEWKKRRTFMRLIHHCVSHPLMALTNGADWAIRFHDWSEDTPALRIYVLPGTPLSPYRSVS